MLALTAVVALFLGRDSLLKVDALSKGQEIEIEITSSGCFHHTISHITVSGGPKRHLTYYQSLEGRWSGRPSDKEPNDLVYDGHLTEEMERQIGLALDYYREGTGRAGGCTTVESLKVRHKVDNRIVGMVRG